MHYLQKKQSRFAYLPWLQQLQDYGEPVDVRGHKTREFLNCITEITEPWHHCILLPSRRWNPFLALSEALWILAGRDDVDALRPYNSHISNYSDDGRVLYGAYGKRIYHQIDPLIERLRKDPSDRRAVLQIWDSGEYVTPKEDYHYGGYMGGDLLTNSKDPPCNNMVYFKLRENKLHMTVINRSNDLHFGLMAVNLPTFGILQSYIAARLGVDMGTQTHFSNSLHIYTDDKRAAAITDRMLYTESEDMPVYPAHELVFTSRTIPDNHEEFAKQCSLVLDECLKEDDVPFRYKEPFPEFLLFAVKYLWAYKTRNFKPDYFMDTWPQYADWVLSGDLFISKVWK